MSVEIDLSDRTVLITGASRGIGRAAAELIGRAGARVVVHYGSQRSAAEEVVRTIGPERSVAVQADLASNDDIQALAGSAIERFGRIDVLVNNAAIFTHHPFDGESFEEWVEGWRTVFDVNLFGTAQLTWLAMRSMREHGGGTVINVASRASTRGETEYISYGASKAALLNLTRSIARACAKDGITSNAITPGFIDTDMAADEVARRGDELRAEVPLGRLGIPADVAGVILFLASPLASYLNGATIDVNGGSWFS
ncbi:MAG: glucose 1-dehydrogenase [Acidobacteria bacterium]|nr:glucose 1-dehydrogenase [Acidobacteriota bacterium]